MRFSVVGGRLLPVATSESVILGFFSWNIFTSLFFFFFFLFLHPFQDGFIPLLFIYNFFLSCFDITSISLGGE